MMTMMMIMMILLVMAIIMIRDALKKELRDYLGIFPKWQTPLPPPTPFWEPLIQKKNYRLFCILDPWEHFWFSPES